MQGKLLLTTFVVLALSTGTLGQDGWLAQDVSWVADSSGRPYVSSVMTHDAAKTLDGDTGTWWNPQGVSGDWYIVLDLAEPHTLTRIAINNYGDTIHDIAAFTLQKSQVGSPYSWEDVVSVTNVQLGTDQRQKFGEFLGTARYWRFLITRTGTETGRSYQPLLRELNLYGISPDSSSSEEEPDPRTDGCAIDVVLVVDDSSSITPSLFLAAKTYMDAFVDCFDDTDDVNVGVVLYNCEARTEVPLGKYTASNHLLMYAIGGLGQQGGVTRTGPAIRYMKDTFNFRGGTQRVAIVLTDGYIQGEPLDDHVAEANAARAAGITLYSVGLGDNLDSGVLEDIGGSPGNVFDDIDPCDLADQIVKDQCEKDSRGSSSGSSSGGGGSSGGSGSVGSGGSSGSGGSNGGGASESKSKASESKSKASESQSGGASESKSKASESKSKASEG